MNDTETFITLRYGKPKFTVGPQNSWSTNDDMLEWLYTLPEEVIRKVHKKVSDRYTGPGTLYPLKWKSERLATQMVQLSYCTHFLYIVRETEKALLEYHSNE